MNWWKFVFRFSQTNNTNIDGFKKFLTLEDGNSSLGINETIWWTTYKNPLFKGIAVNYNSFKFKYVIVKYLILRLQTRQVGHVCHEPEQVEILFGRLMSLNLLYFGIRELLQMHCTWH